MDKRQMVIQRAEELGLKFAKNAKTEYIEKIIAEEEANIVMNEARSAVEAKSEVFTPESDEELVVDNNVESPDIDKLRTQLKKELEVEYENKLRELQANMEANLNDKAMSGNVPIGKQKLDLQKKATKLVRCVVSSRDPMKQSWPGEIITVSNDMTGLIKKFVPFNIDAGYHLPQMIVNVLKDKTCTVFVNKKINGETVKTGKQIKAYNIEILPPLTEHELTELAREQAARGSVD